MRPIPEGPWPPSVSALSPLPEGPLQGRGADRPSDPLLTILRQHRELAHILADLVAAADQVNEESIGPGEQDPAWRRLRHMVGQTGRFMAPHRDTEESVLFPHLLEDHPEVADRLDELGDDHVRIFAEANRVEVLIDRPDPNWFLDLQGRAEVILKVRAFARHIWRHTLVEEELLRGLRIG